MAFGAQYVKPTSVDDLRPLRIALLRVALPQPDRRLPARAGAGFPPACAKFPVGQALRVPAEHDVDPAARHVGGHRNCAGLPSLGDDLRLPEVLLGVENLVVDAPLVKLPRELFRLVDRHRADQDRLAGPLPVHDVLHQGGELPVLGLVDQVTTVVPDHRPVGGDRYHL